MKEATLRNRMRDYLVVTTMQSHNDDMDAAIAHWTRVTGQSVNQDYPNAVKLRQLLDYRVFAIDPAGLASSVKTARLTVKRIADDYHTRARAILGTAY